MTTQFEGIVINPGSTNDGKRKAGKTSFLRLPEVPLVPHDYSTGKQPAKVEAKVVDYVFVRISHGSGAEWGFWVPDGRDGAWAMEALVAGYRRGRK